MCIVIMIFVRYANDNDYDNINNNNTLQSFVKMYSVGSDTESAVAGR